MSVPPSDEVKREEEKARFRLENEERLKQEEIQAAEAIEIAEREHIEQQQAEHNTRIEAAKAFDWDAWEKETGLKRPEIG